MDNKNAYLQQYALTLLPMTQPNPSRARHKHGFSYDPKIGNRY
jgi:hypothetical protein